MRIKLRYLVRSGGPNFTPSVRGPVRLVRSENIHNLYRQKSFTTMTKFAKLFPRVTFPTYGIVYCIPIDERDHPK